VVEQTGRGERAYACPNGHSYDLAKEGYVHLLPANRMHSKTPGDDKGMAAARSRFLSQGFYRHLLDKLCQLAVEHTPDSPSVLDAGCGEGYYTAGIDQALAEAGRMPRMAGVDLSKPSLRWAAKREKDVEFAVASVYRLPVADASVDLLLNCFSPLALEEFRRVLKPGGVFLYVVPAADHLWELKEVLYEKPYPNTEEESPYEGFEYLGIEKAERTIHLEGSGPIRDLFGMTPYAWKTPKEGIARLDALTKLDVQAAFRIHMFRSLA
ncbi:MAG: methyltransferase domain-containing protein, partial [Clostridia bacterium]|nr:methyltransferase domain-containing protein [Clostridia bacterium]